MSNEPRFTLNVVTRELPQFIDGKLTRVTRNYYVIGTNKADGCRGAIFSLKDLEYRQLHGAIRTKDYSFMDLVTFFLNNRWYSPPEYIGHFRTIQDIILTIKVLQL